MKTARLAAVWLAIAPVAASAQGVPPLGDAPLGLDGALRAFQSICLENLPRFKAATAVLVAQEFAQNPETGTWYHPRDEISVSLEPHDGRAVCSIVFESTEQPGLLGIALATAAASTGSGDVAVDPTTGAAQATAAGGAKMVFTPAIGGTPNLFRAVVAAGQ